MGYYQEEDERHQIQHCRWPEGHYPSNLGLRYTWAVPQADCLHATPHWCSNSCKRRPNQVLSEYKWTYFSEAWHFCLKYLFLLILCNILLFWDTEFGVFLICKPYSSKFQEIKAWNISLCVINLYNTWFSLSVMSDNKYVPCSWASIFFRCTCISKTFVFWDF